MSVIVRKKVNWAKFLRMIGSLNCDIPLVAYENGDFDRPEVVDELNAFCRCCQELETRLWRIYDLINVKNVTDNKEVE